MKLLLDENLSYRLVKVLQASFPGTKHVTDIRPRIKGDRAIFLYAKDNGFVIVTFDSDFVQLTTLQKDPPKILLVKLKNPNKAAIVSLFSLRRSQIEAFNEMNSLGSPAVLEING